MINICFKAEPPLRLGNPYKECHMHLLISTYILVAVAILWLNYALIILIFDDT